MRLATDLWRRLFQQTHLRVGWEGAPFGFEVLAEDLVAVYLWAPPLARLGLEGLEGQGWGQLLPPELVWLAPPEELPEELARPLFRARPAAAPRPQDERSRAPLERGELLHPAVQPPTPPPRSYLPEPGVAGPPPPAALRRRRDRGPAGQSGSQTGAPTPVVGRALPRVVGTPPLPPPIALRLRRRENAAGKHTRSGSAPEGAGGLRPPLKQKVRPATLTRPRRLGGGPADLGTVGAGAPSAAPGGAPPRRLHPRSVRPLQPFRRAREILTALERVPRADVAPPGSGGPPASAPAVVGGRRPPWWRRRSAPAGSPMPVTSPDSIFPALSVGRSSALAPPAAGLPPPISGGRRSSGGGGAPSATSPWAPPGSPAGQDPPPALVWVAPVGPWAGQTPPPEPSPGGPEGAAPPPPLLRRGGRAPGRTYGASEGSSRPQLPGRAGPSSSPAPGASSLPVPGTLPPLGVGPPQPGETSRGAPSAQVPRRLGSSVHPPGTPAGPGGGQPSALPASPAPHPGGRALLPRGFRTGAPPALPEPGAGPPGLHPLRGPAPAPPMGGESALADVEGAPDPAPGGAPSPPWWPPNGASALHGAPPPLRPAAVGSTPPGAGRRGSELLRRVGAQVRYRPRLPSGANQAGGAGWEPALFGVWLPAAAQLLEALVEAAEGGEPGAGRRWVLPALPPIPPSLPEEHALVQPGAETEVAPGAQRAPRPGLRVGAPARGAWRAASGAPHPAPRAASTGGRGAMLPRGARRPVGLAPGLDPGWGGELTAALARVALAHTVRLSAARLSQWAERLEHGALLMVGGEEAARVEGVMRALRARGQRAERSPSPTPREESITAPGGASGVLEMTGELYGQSEGVWMPVPELPSPPQVGWQGGGQGSPPLEEALRRALLTGDEEPRQGAAGEGPGPGQLRGRWSSPTVGALPGRGEVAWPPAVIGSDEENPSPEGLSPPSRRWPPRAPRWPEPPSLLPLATTPTEEGAEEEIRGAPPAGAGVEARLRAASRVLGGLYGGPAQEPAAGPPPPPTEQGPAERTHRAARPPRAPEQAPLPLEEIAEELAWRLERRARWEAQRW